MQTKRHKLSCCADRTWLHRLWGWPGHLTRSWLRADIGIDLFVGLPAVTGVFLIELHSLAISLDPGRNVQRLLQLVVSLAHFHVTIEALDLHAFERVSDLYRIGRLGMT